MSYFFKYYLLISLLFLTFLSSCQERNPPDLSVKLSKSFTKAVDYGKIDNDDIQEASGLAYSKSMPNAIWTHNDSGDKARVFLMNEKGEHLGEFKLKGVEARDWEDIATCYDSKKKKSYLYIAEMGDNQAKYKVKYIYKFPEPKPSKDKKKKIEDFETIKFKFPDGKRDAETLMIDPLTQDIYIVSKREDNVRVYVLPAKSIKKDKVNILEKVATLHFHNANSGDISPDGKEILIKTYGNIYYWKRKKNESIADALSRQAVRLQYKPEPQGESVAWKADGSGFFTTSEEVGGREAVLSFYKRKK